MLALGGLQGAIGWWMVASAFRSASTSASTGWRSISPSPASSSPLSTYIARGLATYSEAPAGRGVQRFAGIMVLLVLFQIYLGALVAGLHAGLTYNTWPLMDGAIIPGDLFVIEPAWRNLFENPKTVQFIHRMFAYAVLVVALWHAFATVAGRAGHDPCAPRLGAGRPDPVCRPPSASARLLMQAHMHWALLHQGVCAGRADLRHRPLARHQGRLSAADRRRGREHDPQRSRRNRVFGQDHAATTAGRRPIRTANVI